MPRARSTDRLATRAGEASAAVVGPVRSLSALRESARDCRACPLWKLGTQTVFGQGPRTARIILVGEQPGDREDREGAPFVGPAGQLLDRALGEAGIDRPSVYVTNSVKHFKWEPKGPRRIHKTPNAREIAACRPWLEAEIRLLRPELIVCLGGTAVRSVFGKPMRVLENRGRLEPTPWGIPALITVHPSSLLRLRDREEAHRAFEALVADLRKIARATPGPADTKTPEAGTRRSPGGRLRRGAARS